MTCSYCVQRTVTHPETHHVKQGARPFRAVEARREAVRRFPGEVERQDAFVAQLRGLWKDRHTVVKESWKRVTCSCRPAGQLLDRDANACRGILHAGLCQVLFKSRRPSSLCPRSGPTAEQSIDVQHGSSSDALRVLVDLADAYTEALGKLTSLRAARRRTAKGKYREVAASPLPADLLRRVRLEMKKANDAPPDKPYPPRPPVAV